MKKKKFIEKLFDDYQFIIRNMDNLKEVVSFRFNLFRLLIVGFILKLIFVCISIVLVRMVLKKWLDPVYIERTNKIKLKKLSQTIILLEKQVDDQEKFIALLQKNISGEDGTGIKREMEMEIEHKPLEDFSKYKNEDTYVDSFFSPINGLVTSQFDLNSGHYGTDIVSKENEPIKAIDDGTVISSSWESENGWVMIIQHKNNILSVYKHNSALLKKSGERVKKGDVVAIVGNSGELSMGQHLHLEIWRNGSPVDPEKMIDF